MALNNSLNKQHYNVDNKNVLEEGELTLQVNKITMLKLITDNYSNPTLAVVKELYSNAIDAHQEYFQLHGKYPDKKIFMDIFKTKLDEHYFVIRDYGVGLSPERINEIYKVIGSSTKTGTNKQIGQFGIGSKSPLAISNNFYVISFYEGYKYRYHCYIDNDKIVFNKESQEKTDQPNGVEYNIFLDETILQAFVRNFMYTLQFNYDKCSHLFSKILFPYLKLSRFESDDISCQFLLKDSTEDDNVIILQGNTPYYTNINIKRPLNNDINLDKKKNIIHKIFNYNFNKINNKKEEREYLNECKKYIHFNLDDCSSIFYNPNISNFIQFTFKYIYSCEIGTYEPALTREHLKIDTELGLIRSKITMKNVFDTNNIMESSYALKNVSIIKNKNVDINNDIKIPIHQVLKTDELLREDLSKTEIIVDKLIDQLDNKYSEYKFNDQYSLINVHNNIFNDDIFVSNIEKSGSTIKYSNIFVHECLVNLPNRFALTYIIEAFNKIKIIDVNRVLPDNYRRSSVNQEYRELILKKIDELSKEYDRYFPILVSFKNIYKRDCYNKNYIPMYKENSIVRKGNEIDEIVFTQHSAYKNINDDIYQSIGSSDQFRKQDIKPNKFIVVVLPPYKVNNYKTFVDSFTKSVRSEDAKRERRDMFAKYTNNFISNGDIIKKYREHDISEDVNDSIIFKDIYIIYTRPIIYKDNRQNIDYNTFFNTEYVIDFTEEEYDPKKIINHLYINNIILYRIFKKMFKESMEQKRLFKSIIACNIIENLSLIFQNNKKYLQHTHFNKALKKLKNIFRKDIPNNIIVSRNNFNDKMLNDIDSETKKLSNYVLNMDKLYILSGTKTIQIKHNEVSDNIINSILIDYNKTFLSYKFELEEALKYAINLSDDTVIYNITIKCLSELIAIRDKYESFFKLTEKIYLKDISILLKLIKKVKKCIVENTELQYNTIESNKYNEIIDLIDKGNIFTMLNNRRYSMIYMQYAKNVKKNKSLENANE